MTSEIQRGKTNVQMLGVGEHVYSRVKTSWSVFLKISVMTHLEERISMCIITKTAENLYFQLDKILNVLATCNGRGINNFFLQESCELTILQNGGFSVDLRSST